MGDPKFSRRKYQTPSHPWQKERIDEENEIIRKYGLKNKTELWKAQSLLRGFRQRSRNLQALIRYGNEQAEKEKEELLKRLERMGMLGDDATLDDVLALDVDALLSRRLQTLAYMKGLSSSQKQARQFIVHGHIAVDNKKVTIPGYHVKRVEEEVIEYLLSSPIANDLHPARPKDELEKATEEQPVVTEEDEKKTESTEDPTKEKDTKESPEDKPEKPTKQDKPEEPPKGDESEKPTKQDKPEEPPKEDKPEEVTKEDAETQKEDEKPAEVPKEDEQTKADEKPVEAPEKEPIEEKSEENKKTDEEETK